MQNNLTNIKTIAVIGAGQMGGGIAQVAAQSGLNVFIYDNNEESLKKSSGITSKSLQKFCYLGKICNG